MGQSCLQAGRLDCKPFGFGSPILVRVPRITVLAATWLPLVPAPHPALVQAGFHLFLRKDVDYLLGIPLLFEPAKRPSTAAGLCDASRLHGRAAKSPAVLGVH